MELRSKKLVPSYQQIYIYIYSINNPAVLCKRDNVRGAANKGFSTDEVEKMFRVNEAHIRLSHQSMCKMALSMHYKDKDKDKA